jgi:hypothetical protein
MLSKNKQTPFEISGFHDGDYEECRLLGCDAVYLLMEAIYLFETPLLPRTTRRYIPEDGTLQTNSMALRSQASYSD